MGEPNAIQCYIVIQVCVHAPCRVGKLTDTELSAWAGRSGSLKPSRTPLPLCLAIATFAGVASLAFQIIGTYCVLGGKLVPCTVDDGIQEVSPLAHCDTSHPFTHTPGREPPHTFP